MQAVLRRLAHDLRAERVGDDQPGVLRENLARHFERGGEEQPVAMRAIVHPFLVGAEILDRGLDLDDPDLARSVERDEVGAPPDGSGNSLTAEKPNWCSSRMVPRATASAVCDWRPSAEGARRARSRASRRRCHDARTNQVRIGSRYSIFKPKLLDDARPFRPVGGDVGGVFLAASSASVSAPSAAMRDFTSSAASASRSAALSFADDRGRRVRRRDDAVALRRLVAGQGLGRGRHVGQQRRTLRAGDRDRAHLAFAHQADRGRQAGDTSC